MSSKRVSDNASSELLPDQAEANEHLVLASLRAHEEADSARVEAARAEGRATEIAAREEQLRITAEFRESMIGIVGHDLRNPLNAIAMAAELLLYNARLNEEDASLVSRIVKSSQRMDRMTVQLLDFTRARLGGGFPLKLTHSNLGEVCRMVVEELCFASSADIVQSVEGDVTGVWDEDRLAEVISNITGNAVSYATPGTPIAVHVYEAGDSVVAVISNQGATIPTEALRVIFLPFRRAQGDAADTDGHMGLGLYVAHEVVASHGGSLGVESLLGTTTFTVTLPRISVPPEASRSTP